MKVSALLQKLGFLLTTLTVLVTPIFFLTITSEYYDFNKQVILVVLSLLSLVVLAGVWVSERQVRITHSPLGLPILLFLVTFIISTFVKAPNRLDTFINPGQTGSYLVLGVLFFCSINFIRSKRELDILSSSLSLSCLILAIYTITASFVSSLPWIPTGNHLATLTVFVTLLPFFIIQLLSEKNLNFKSGILAVTFAVTLVAAGLLVYHRTQSIILDQKTGWAIALETLKTSPLVGTGPDSFLSDFTRFRPVSFNLSPDWLYRFTTSSNYYLQLLSTLGVLGLAAYLFIVWKVSEIFSKTLKSTSRLTSATFASVLAIFISQLFLPGYFVQTILLFILFIIGISNLKISGSSLVSESNLDLVASSSKSQLLPVITLLIILGLVIPASYLEYRIYASEFIFQKALVSAAKNDGKTTYETLAEAISLNPYRDSYRVAYSQTNFLIANSLASRKDISDDDKNTISQLVQQAIREAKNAVALNPTKVTNLENLANIYRSLLGFAQGADTWAIASFRQAITLDPVNPNLRIALGGVFYAQKNYDDAIRIFQSAVDLKPDLANAYYNLAVAYREKGDLTQAITAYQNTLNYLDKSSADYTKASAELALLQKKAGETNIKTQGSQLTTPTTPSNKLNPQLKLDESLSPNSPSTPSSQP